MANATRHQSGLLRMERHWGILLAMPAILGFLIFTIVPMIASVGISLTNWNIAGDAEFIGLANYEEVFTEDPLFRQSLLATTSYALGAVPASLLIAFLAALILNQKVRGLPVFRTVFYLPVLVPTVVNTALWLWLFNPDFGLLNAALQGIGLQGSQWIYAEETAIPSLVLMNVWGFGNAAVIFLAGLQGVPGHLYDAVSVDGGGPFHRFRDVTLPMMTPTIFFNLVMGLIFTFQAFAEPYLMTNGGPNNSTLFYVYYLYRTAFTESRMGYASTLAWLLFVVILVITVLVFRSARHWVYYEVEGRT